MKKTGILCITILTVLLVSCASTPYTQKETSVLKLVNLINGGKVTKVEGLSATPFVLDTETLYLESDVDTLWNNLKKASFKMTNARFIRTELTGPTSYKIFADTYDMKNYFAKYTGKNTSIVTIETDDGTYFLILDRKVWGYPRIQGFKGPVK